MGSFPKQLQSAAFIEKVFVYPRCLNILHARDNNCSLSLQAAPGWTQKQY